MDKNITQNKDISDDNLLKEMKAIGDKCVGEVREKVKDKQYSDVIIPQKDGQQELQFVNLVQEGGGVWGIALVGYTYVLEGMGIRFMKLAGTSAGAINTMVTAAVGKREDAKSDKILEYLVRKDFSELIDGHPIAKSFIKWFIFQKNAGTKIINSILYIFLSSIGFMFLGSLLMWARPNGILSLEIWLVITAIAFLLIYRFFVKNKTQEPIEKENTNEETGDSKATSKSDINKQIIAFIGVFMGCLMLIYVISLYSNKCQNFQIWLDCLFVGAFFVFSIFTCLRSNSFVLPIQLLGSFVSFVVLIIAIMHINHFYPLEQILRINTNTPPPSATAYLHTSTLGISLFIILIAYFGSLGFFLYKRFTNSRYGINPGINFRDWIDEIMVENKTKTFADLKEKFNQPIDGIKHRKSRDIDDLLTYDQEDDEESVCLITGEIYTNTKIEFPKMAPMFWEKPEQICLADLVRASMSIPIFFEAFRRKPEQIPASGSAMRRKYMMVGELTETHLTDIENHTGFAFMDGGIISNFPINKFFKPILYSRLPTFGVLLNDPYKTPSDSLFSIIGSVFNTSRKHYDRSFLAEHEFYQQCISNIDVKEINWLNFELEDKEKIELFRAGAEAAQKFLIDFCWVKYQTERNQWILKFLKTNPTK
jgi:predicted acylesterase/phospholipase RssA